MWKKILNYWPLIFFALILIPYSICVWSHTPSKGADNPDCASYASSLSRYEVVTAATDDTAEQRKTEYDDKVKLKAELECSDLHAQWAMADVTFWAFGAGLAGIALVFWTLLATRQAAQVSKDSAKDELRAYVEAKEVSYGINITIEAVNTGSTPAKWFEVGAVSKAIKVPADIDWDAHIDFSEVERFQRWPALTVKHTALLQSKNEASNMAKVRASKNLHMLVYGTIRYKTIFDEELETEFAFIANMASLNGQMKRVPFDIKTFQPIAEKKKSTGT